MARAGRVPAPTGLLLLWARALGQTTPVQEGSQSQSTAQLQTVSAGGGGASSTIASSGFGGLQLGADFLSPEACAALIAQQSLAEVATALPCECRTFSRRAVPCHPSCCPKAAYYEGGDRCHQENRLAWSVWEQRACRPSTTQENYPGDGVCLYNGGNPFDVIAHDVAERAQTTLTFTLSKRAEHRCEDLVVSHCPAQRAADAARYRTERDSELAGEVCWSECPPLPLRECEEHNCPYNRGRTHPFITSWTVPRLTTGHVYLLSCMTTANGTSADSGEATAGNINQTQFLPTAFRAP